MYAVTRKYQFNPTASAEIAQHVQDGLLPLLRQMPGFVAYYWLDNVDGQGVSISVFADQAGADDSVRLAADYVKEHLVTVLGAPEIFKGDVRAHS